MTQDAENVAMPTECELAISILKKCAEGIMIERGRATIALIDSSWVDVTEEEADYLHRLWLEYGGGA